MCMKLLLTDASYAPLPRPSLSSFKDAMEAAAPRMLSPSPPTIESSQDVSSLQSPPASPARKLSSSNYCSQSGVRLRALQRARSLEQPKAALADKMRIPTPTPQTCSLLPKGRTIDDEHWPPIFNPKHVRNAKRMRPRPSDVYVCTYPKCGTTWIQHIVHQLLGKDLYDDDDEFEGRMGRKKKPAEPAPTGNLNKMQRKKKKNAMCFTSPMIERMGAKYCWRITEPRILKSHFNYNSMPKGNGAKYIYAVRNPKDCLTSYFFHYRNFKLYDWPNGDFNVFYELFMSGEVGFGDYFVHLNSWLEALKRKEENILFLKYEDMVADLRGSIEKIGRFIGGIAEAAVNDPVTLDRITENSMIDAMKVKQSRWFPADQLHQEQFIRKGGSRDWKNHFTREQSDLMDERFAKRTRGTAAAGWWRDEMAWDEPRPYSSRAASASVASTASDISLPEISTSYAAAVAASPLIAWQPASAAFRPQRTHETRFLRTSSSIGSSSPSSNQQPWKSSAASSALSTPPIGIRRCSVCSSVDSGLSSAASAALSLIDCETCGQRPCNSFLDSASAVLLRQHSSHLDSFCITSSLISNAGCHFEDSLEMDLTDSEESGE